MMGRKAVCDVCYTSNAGYSLPYLKQWSLLHLEFLWLSWKETKPLISCSKYCSILWVQQVTQLQGGEKPNSCFRDGVYFISVDCFIALNHLLFIHTVFPVLQIPLADCLNCSYHTCHLLCCLKMKVIIVWETLCLIYIRNMPTIQGINCMMYSKLWWPYTLQSQTDFNNCHSQVPLSGHPQTTALLIQKSSLSEMIRWGKFLDKKGK